jgi:undecaprenyl-diphosphatase
LSLIEAIVLGIVQGLTEFLPISSSAHQRIVASFFGWDDPGAAFTAVSQLGTEAAVLIYFRHDLWRITTTFLRSLRDASLRSSPDARMGWFIIIATVPLGGFGLIFENQIEEGARDLYLIGTVLIVFALILLWADKRARLMRDLHELSWRDGILIGLAQAMALVPGVSRSGATMTAGLLLGLQRPAAARFSFLLAIPAVLTSGFFQLYGILSGEESGDDPFGYIVIATLISFAIGYAAIAWLLRYLATHTVGLFVWYRVALGTLVLVLVSAGAIS